VWVLFLRDERDGKTDRDVSVLPFVKEQRVPVKLFSDFACKAASRIRPSGCAESWTDYPFIYMTAQGTPCGLESFTASSSPWLDETKKSVQM